MIAAACHVLGAVSAAVLLVCVGGSFVECAEYCMRSGSESLDMPEPNDIDRDRAMSLRGKE